MNKAESAALICRVSTREQEDGYSLEAQERLLREHCDRRGLKVEMIRSFSETASKYEQRKKFLEFVSDVKKAGICHIVAEKVDRVSRSGSRDAVLIDEWIEEDSSRHVHLVKQSLDIHKYAPSTQKFVWNMHVAVAKHTSDNLSEEVRKAADVMLQRGIWPTKPPIGYIRDKSIQHSPIQPHTTTAPLVQEMFKLYDSGDWSVERLSFKMEGLGLLNSNNHRIMPSRIHALLQDPFYIGKMDYRGQVWQGAHEPLISLELFERVQRRLKRKERGVGATLYSKHDHLLRGFTVCSGCGKRISWEIHKSHTYGYCKQYGRCSQRAVITESKTEKQLLPHLEALKIENERLADWIYRALKAAGTSDNSAKLASKKQLEERINSVSSKLERLLELRIEGEIEKEDYERKREEYSREKERLKQQLTLTDKQPSGEIEDPAEIFRIGQEAAVLFSSSLPNEKRKILKKLITQLAVSGSSVSVSYTRSYAKLAQAVALTNSSKITKTLDFSKPNFELVKISSEKKKDPRFHVSHSSWLPG